MVYGLTVELMLSPLDIGTWILKVITLGSIINYKGNYM
jgi:hypothetical protein